MNLLRKYKSLQGESANKVEVRNVGQGIAGEVRELDSWMEVEENRELAGRVWSDEVAEEVMKVYAGYDAGKAYAQFVARIGNGETDGGKSAGTERKSGDKGKIGEGRNGRQMLGVWRTVAAVAVPLALGAVLFFDWGKDVPGVEERIVPGSGKAVLVLSGGVQVALGVDEEVFRRDTNGVALKADSAVLVYENTSEAVAVKPKYNELIVPRGGEYALQLADGTQVWLNADSRLRYPERFGTGCREVELSGEACFKVVKDAARPFVVKAGGVDVRVLGTEFNVNAYGNGNVTTLVSGKVEVSDGRTTMMLEPGEQVTVKDAVFSKAEVDTGKVVAWKDGIVAFEDERLEDVMLRLERWYDIQVFFSNQSLKDVRITGYINRYGDIRILLDKLEKLDLAEFEVKGKCVTVHAR